MSSTIKQLKSVRQSILHKEERLIFLYGDNEFLLGMATDDLQLSLSRKGISSLRQEAKSENSESFEEKFLQESLFAEEINYIFVNAEQAPKLPQLLQEVSHKKKLTNTLLIVYNKASVQNVLKTELKRLEAVEILCNSPKPFEQKDIFQFLCEKEGLNLDQKALDALGEQFGNNFTGFQNELHKLSLIKGRTSEKLSWSEIKNFVEGLREEEAFQLTSLLLEKKLPEAQARMTHLLHTGDNGLSILGIISYFCRTALYLKSEASSLKKIGSSSKLPNFLRNRYNRHMHLHSEASLREALRRCVEADLFLKSRGRSQQLIHLSQIILAL